MIVLDTNILVAALWSRTGASFRIFESVIKGETNVAVSVALALEYEDVLKRAVFREASWASDGDLELLLDELLGTAVLIAPIDYRLRPVLTDADDDMVLECAVQARAEAIVTMNIRDFSGIAPRYGIEVLQPGQWLQRERKSAT